jgi:hypothetical protein
MTALTLAVLGAVLALGLSGAVGGTESVERASSDVATLALRGPETVRNGEYLELTVTMSPHRGVANAALEIDAAYWRNVTVNTMIPAPEKEEYKDGVMRFEFGPLGAGESAAVKIDGQVNPHRFGPSRGDFAFLDGDSELVRLDRGLRVIP